MKLLVIEDEKKIADSIKKLLENSGHKCRVCLSGDEGMLAVFEEYFDLVILDLMLPVVDGWTILTKMREEKLTTPVLVLSAKSEVWDKVKGLDIGGDDYLAKPFHADELMARVRAITRRPREAKREKLVYGELSLDTGTGVVKRGANKINLTKKEFEIMSLLIKNPNKVHSKEEIIDKLWGFDDDILPNTVEVNISYLRKKINSIHPTKPLIHTVRGFGYKLS